MAVTCSLPDHPLTHDVQLVSTSPALPCATSQSSQVNTRTEFHDSTYHIVNLARLCICVCAFLFYTPDSLQLSHCSPPESSPTAVQKLELHLRSSATCICLVGFLTASTKAIAAISSGCC